SVSTFLWFFCCMLACSSISALFPYTTLFRSDQDFPRAVRFGTRVAFELAGRLSTLHASPDDEVVRAFGKLSARLEYGDVSEVTRSEEHTSELQSLTNLVCRLLLENKKTTYTA